MTNLIKDVKKGRIKSAYVAAPFDVAKTELERNNYKVISAEQNARLRLQEFRNFNLLTRSNWTKEGLIFIPKGNSFYFTFDSPVMEFPSDAKEAHRNKKPFYISKKQKEKALSNSIKINYNKGPVPTKELHNDEVTAQIFGEAAKEYGKLLEGMVKLNEFSFWSGHQDFVRKQRKPFATQFSSLSLETSYYRYSDPSNLSHSVTGVRGIL